MAFMHLRESSMILLDMIYQIFIAQNNDNPNIGDIIMYIIWAIIGIIVIFILIKEYREWRKRALLEPFVAKPK